ncbi:MAG: DUF1552 domain-containing protein [Planctomycetes bacterium]|nr:DUF1552 domain-containing protein [Planctomycetota bacterium]
MRPIRQLALDRRTFLRGAATCIAVPWLEAMAPALRPLPAAPRRALFVFAPNGVNQQAWSIAGQGREAVLDGTLLPLRPLQQRLTVFSGLAIEAGRSRKDGTGDHARAAATFLTCRRARKTGGADIEVGVSSDQVIAQAVGDATRFRSLEVGIEAGAAAGICDSGYSCAYSNNISWRTPNAPVAKETSPKAVFARLFGDPERIVDAEAQRRQRERSRSVLDAVLGDAKALAGKVGAADARKLDQYLQSVRELEQRLERAPDEDGPQTPLPEGLLAAGRPLGEKVALMYELLALAFATDSTRVATFMLGNGGSNLSYPFLGVPESHHELSHHGGKQDKLAAIAKINRFHAEQFAAFLQRLAAHDEGGADLLASSLIVYGSGIGDGNRHNHDHLPIVLAGEGGGAAAGRGHVAFERETPMADLHLAVQQAMGVVAEEFADSRGALALR